MQATENNPSHTEEKKKKRHVFYHLVRKQTKEQKTRVTIKKVGFNKEHVTEIEEGGFTQTAWVCVESFFVGGNLSTERGEM